MEVGTNLLLSLILGLSIIVKIGLFPGHIWGLHIYNSASIPVIMALTSIGKIAPLIMLALWYARHMHKLSELFLFI